MKLLTIAINILLMFVNLQAQNKKPDLAGVYYIHGIMETATGLELHKDSTFEFFFVYGALDRIGSGKWSFVNNKIILNTRPRPQSDFKLEESKKVPGDKITVQMKGDNPIILSNVNSVLTTSGKTLEETTNQDGMASFPLQEAKKISLIFTICPDRFSDFALVKDHNFYSFSLQPWITEIFLENFTLNLDKKGNLSGNHPLLEPKTYVYERSNEKE